MSRRGFCSQGRLMRQVCNYQTVNMRQLEQWEMFDGPRDAPAVIPPIDPNVHHADRARLSRQSAAIVERLRRGPATNDELSRIARKYTSRVSDIRAAGCDVRLVRRFASGLTWYALFENERMVGQFPPEGNHG